MGLSVLISEKASKDLDGLDKAIRDSVLNKLMKLKENPELGKPLSKEFKNKRKLRVGKYRIVYFLEDEKIFIVRVRHRKEAYLPR